MGCSLSSKLFGLSFVAMVLVSLTGCGGNSGGAGSSGGGGGAGSPTVVTLSFSGGTPSAIAAKIGSRDLQHNNTQFQQSQSFNSQRHYELRGCIRMHGAVVSGVSVCV